MNTSNEQRVRVSSPAELIASIPSMLGINPTASLILLCFDTAHSQSRLSRLLRVDLPAPHHYNGLAMQLSHHVRQDKPSSVVAVVVDDASAASHRGLINAVASVLATIEVPLVEALWTKAIRQGAPWCSYYRADGGTLPDPAGTKLAAVKAAGGEPVFSSRDELVESIQSGLDAVTVRRRTILAQDMAHDLAAQRRTNPLDAFAAACTAVDEAIQFAARGHTS